MYLTRPILLLSDLSKSNHESLQSNVHMEEVPYVTPLTAAKLWARFLCILVFAISMAGSMNASAQGYPAKPITLVVVVPPGAATDIFARVIARRMAELMGRQVVVLNRDGASGRIGTQFVAKSAPDGYTLLWQSSSLTIRAVWDDSLPYDPIRDFLPIGLVAKIPFLLVVHPSVPVKNVKELITLAKSRPGKLNYGSAGSFGFTHLAAELLKLKAKIDILHVPYRGTALVASDLLGGQIDLAFVGPTTALPHLSNGKLRALATTGAERSAAFSDIPTMVEAGVADYEFTQWYGMLAPNGTPQALIAILNTTLRKAMDDLDVKKRIVDEAGVVTPTTPEEFGMLLKDDLTKKAKLIKEAGIKRQQ